MSSRVATCEGGRGEPRPPAFDARREHDDAVAVVPLGGVSFEFDVLGEKRPKRLFDSLLVLGSVGECAQFDVVKRDRGHRNRSYSSSTGSRESSGMPCSWPSSKGDGVVGVPEHRLDDLGDRPLLPIVLAVFVVQDDSVVLFECHIDRYRGGRQKGLI